MEVKNNEQQEIVVKTTEKEKIYESNVPIKHPVKSTGCF